MSDGRDLSSPPAQTQDLGETQDFKQGVDRISPSPTHRSTTSIYRFHPNINSPIDGRTHPSTHPSCMSYPFIPSSHAPTHPRITCPLPLTHPSFPPLISPTSHPATYPPTTHPLTAHLPTHLTHTSDHPPTRTHSPTHPLNQQPLHALITILTCLRTRARGRSPILHTPWCCNARNQTRRNLFF